MVGERALKASEALRDIEGTTSLEEARREDGTRTHARIDLRSPSAILGRLGGGLAGRTAGNISRLGSNRGIKALQFYAGFCALL